MMANNSIDFRDIIFLGQRMGGIVTFNGYESLYIALKQVYPGFESMSFSDQMKVVVDATASLIGDIDIATPKTYLYEFFFDEDGYFSFVVSEADNDELVCSYHGTDAFQTFMRDAYDVDGLRRYLVETGQLLPQDILLMKYTNY